jgi:hypothetical protein
MAVLSFVNQSLFQRNSVGRKLCEERKKEQKAARPGGVVLL